MMPTGWISTLAAFAATPTDGAGKFAVGLSLMVVGMAVVFVALVLVGCALVLIRKFGEEQTPKASAPQAAPTPAKSAPAPATPAADDDPIDGRLIAVLTAAAAAVVGGPVRLRRVQFLKGRPDGSWSAAGRSHIHSSHNFQPRKR